MRAEHQTIDSTGADTQRLWGAAQRGDGVRLLADAWQPAGGGRVAGGGAGSPAGPGHGDRTREGGDPGLVGTLPAGQAGDAESTCQECGRNGIEAGGTIPVGGGDPWFGGVPSGSMPQPGC